MKPGYSKLRAVLFTVPLTLAVAGLLMAAESSTSATHPNNNVAPALESETGDVANALSNAFRKVATHVLPSVVAIENRPDTTWQQAKKPTSPDGQNLERSNPFKGTPFEELFPDGLPTSPGQVNPHQAPPSPGGIGSGVIIDSTGVVLTNNHVVAGGGKVIIKTQDGREFVATEVLTDPQTDIAIVKFKGDSSLIAARIGNSDAMEVGDWVVALGQPFGLESTVTAGIVSAKNRGIGITDREKEVEKRKELT